jgi:hypothetical protein
VTVCAAEGREQGREVGEVGVAVADEEDVHGLSPFGVWCMFCW